MAGRRRGAALLLAVLGVAALVAGCDNQFTGTRLRIASGLPSGVYAQVSRALADAWAGQLGIETPEVLPTNGSPDNLAKLRAGDADVAISAADVAVNNTEAADGLREPLALARLYDDYLHVVTRATLPLTTVADLAGRPVSVGAMNSGVKVIADRVLAVAALSTPIQERNLTLLESIEALEAGRIDAFFWSGGLPTTAVSDLAVRLPLKLLDLADLMPTLRKAYPIYNTATIPVSAYHLGGQPVTSLAVPNFLLVSDAMSADLAAALVRGMFDARERLTNASIATLAIDLHAAIETDPVPLHPGALRFYRDVKV